MDNNWIIDNLNYAFGVWNDKLTEMWSLLTQSPQAFKGGTIWQTIQTVNGAMQGIGYGLLVLFLAIGIIILGWGIVQVGMSIQSHDASQRTQGLLCLFGGLLITFAKEILTLIGAV